MAKFVCEEDFSNIKACEGHSCTLVFADRTRRRARRWCSAICGNRAKQAAHRDRLKNKRCFDWANRHREAVKGIAYMEAIMRPQGWDHWDKLNMRPALKALRSEAGEAMVLQDNFFIEKILATSRLQT